MGKLKAATDEELEIILLAAATHAGASGITQDDANKILDRFQLICLETLMWNMVLAGKLNPVVRGEEIAFAKA